jgi:pimeloyl-ACP methyl ester carboxylesterase
MAKRSETRFAPSGDVDIAHQVIGDGDRDIVMTMGWVTHLELMWELPELAYFLDRLSAMGRLIIFDKRGTGLSDRVPGMVTLEQRAADVGAVMDAAGSSRAAFIGWADGGAIGAMFAATHPKRISALVLSAMTFVTTPAAISADPATMQLAWDTIEQGWGSGNLLNLAAPLHASDPRLRAWWRRWERQSATRAGRSLS